jgi:uracil-DNA glycosylase
MTIERKYIRGEGKLDALLMVVGEAPGFHEDQEGRPFVGPSGRLLNKFLRDAGVDRSQCYVTNIVKVRPPDNKFERLREYGISPIDFLPELWAEIQAVRPNCILALGANALKFLTGRSGKGNSISENRGSILRLVPAARHECKVVPSYHPASLLHMRGSDVDDPKVRLYMEMDYKRAVEESQTSEFNLPVRALTIAQNSHDTWRFLKRFKSERMASMDCEVMQAVPTVLGIAFCKEEALAIPLLDFDSAYHKGEFCTSPRDVAQSLFEVFKFIEEYAIDLIGQNFKFDHDKLEPRGLRARGRIIDIMLAHATLYPEFLKSLEFQASVHTREPFWKNDSMYAAGMKALATGCARDAAVTYEIATETILPQLEEFGLKDFYFGFPKGDWRYPFGVEKLHNLYRKMDAVGFNFDPEKNKELKNKYRGMAAAQQLELNMIIGNIVDPENPRPLAINVNSNGANGQVAKLLFDVLKLPSRGKGGRGASEDVLVALMNSPVVKSEEHKRIMSLILEIRRLRKTVSTYLNAELDFDGRMRTNYKIVGTETGRTSTSQQDAPTRPFKMGLAFQTMTKHGEIGPDLRKQFPVDKGYIYMQADSRQAEHRVVSLLARNIEELKRMEDESYDPHARTASWFNPEYTYEQLKKDKLRRFTGKKIRHAGNYDMQKRRCMQEFNNDAKKFNLDIQISEWKADRLLDTFHENDPSIRGVFHSEIRDFVDANKFLISPFGRRREFFGNPDDHGFYKECYAQIPQATVADNTKRAMLGVREEDADVRFILEWHDGFLALVPEKEAEAYARLFISWMEKPIDFSECSLPRGILYIPCEIEVSDQTFYDLKTYTVA